ncbi:MAG TPA: CBS domain-containing protein [Candidatus Polarisedimenticolia bacterium]|nr:CBS domain-containing protein [Candidatus Polarisedimenticolia bacterium]
MICPDCGHENIDGSDSCDECGQDLRSLDIPGSREGIHRTLMETPLREVGPLPPNVLAPTASVLDALRLMQQTRHGSVLIVDGGHLVGIFTERDALDKVAGEPINPAAIPIRELMTPNPETLKEDDVLAFALHRMAVGHYRHIPILRDGRPIGFVSVRGILSYLARKVS